MTREQIRGAADAFSENPAVRLAGRISLAIAGPIMIAGIYLIFQLSDSNTKMKEQLAYLNQQVATIIANQYTAKEALADEKAHLELNRSVDRRLTMIEDHIRRELEMERQRNNPPPSYNLRP